METFKHLAKVTTQMFVGFVGICVGVTVCIGSLPVAVYLAIRNDSNVSDEYENVLESIKSSIINRK